MVWLHDTDVTMVLGREVAKTTCNRWYAVAKEYQSNVWFFRDVISDGSTGIEVVRDIRFNFAADFQMGFIYLSFVASYLSFSLSMSTSIKTIRFVGLFCYSYIKTRWRWHILKKQQMERRLHNAWTDVSK